MTAALAPSESWLALPPVMVKPGPLAGLTARETLGGGIGTRPFVGRQRHLLVGHYTGRLVGDRHRGLDRCELVVEAAALLGRCRSALALQAVFVLTLPRDVVALGYDFGGIQHRDVGVALHREQFRIDGMKRVHLVVLHQADEFTAAADGNFDAVKDHGARSQRNRLKAGRALAIDGRSGHAHRKSRTQQRFARNVRAGGALLHGATHHNILDLGALDFGPRQRRGDRMAQQGRAFGIIERTLVGLADRRTGGRDDYSFSHCFTSRWDATSDVTSRTLSSAARSASDGRSDHRTGC